MTEFLFNVWVVVAIISILLMFTGVIFNHLISKPNVLFFGGLTLFVIDSLIYLGTKLVIFLGGW
jgi:hypothetical protein